MFTALENTKTEQVIKNMTQYILAIHQHIQNTGTSSDSAGSCGAHEGSHKYRENNKEYRQVISPSSDSSLSKYEQCHATEGECSVPLLAAHVSGPCFNYISGRHRARLDASLSSSSTHLSVIDSLVFDPPREPLGGSRASVKVSIRVLLHSACDKGAVFHKRTEDLGVAWTSEKHERPTLVFGLNSRGRDHAVDVGLEDSSTEHRECIANVADGMAGKRLCCAIR